MQWHKIPFSDIPESNTIGKTRIAGKSLCVIRQGDIIHVTGAKCPHAGADLSGGWCEKGQLICPYHRHKFDLLTGKGAAGQYNYIRVYPVRRVSDEWFVGITSGWWRTLIGKKTRD